MSSRWKWTCFVVCTILFGLSPYIFMLINMNITHGNSDLNYYFFYILVTLPIAGIILVIAVITKFPSVGLMGSAERINQSEALLKAIEASNSSASSTTDGQSQR